MTVRMCRYPSRISGSYCSSCKLLHATKSMDILAVHPICDDKVMLFLLGYPDRFGGEGSYQIPMPSFVAAYGMSIHGHTLPCTYRTKYTRYRYPAFRKVYSSTIHHPSSNFRRRRSELRRSWGPSACGRVPSVCSVRANER